MTTARQIWNAILHHGYDLKIMAVENKSVNPFALLAALADVESSFGKNNKSRYEKVFDKGGKYFSEEAYLAFGNECCYSWGPWQIMGTVLYELGLGNIMPSSLESNIDLACEYTVIYLNSRLRHAVNLQDLADGYNTGSYKDQNIPFSYIEKVRLNYANRLEQVNNHYITGEESIFNV